MKYFANIKLFNEQEGGRKNPILHMTTFDYGCPIFFTNISAFDSNQGWDCRLKTRAYGKDIFPGDEVEIEIYFLSESMLSDYIFEGAEFKLKEYGVIGYGEIIEIRE